MTMTMTMVWVLRRREGTRLLVSVLLVSVRGVVGNDHGKRHPPNLPLKNHRHRKYSSVAGADVCDMSFLNFNFSSLYLL